MPQISPTKNMHNNKGGYKLTISPGKPHRLLVAIYGQNESQPKYSVGCNPDDESVAYHFFPADMQDGRIALYCQLENFGLQTVEVTLQRDTRTQTQVPTI